MRVCFGDLGNVLSFKFRNPSTVNIIIAVILIVLVVSVVAVDFPGGCPVTASRI